MPELIGRYEIIRQLGAGGMAVVYLALDPTMKRQVAIKVLPRQFTHDPQFRARFSREAQVIASLEHSAIVPVYDFGESNEQPYIVMRYMPGGSLADRMARGPLTATELAALFTRLASALDIAHKHGIVHRDLKPANILFDQQGDPFLSDFGIVKIAETTSTNTFTGTAIIGTPAYMSPEQAAGKGKVDGRSDVYSLGVILFELLTNAQPFTADTPMGQAVAHIIEPIPSVLAKNPKLPPEAETLIQRALAKKPDDRFQTAGDLAMAIAQMTGARQAAGGNINIAPKQAVRPTHSPNSPVTTLQDAPPTGQRKRLPATLISFVGVGLAGLVMLVCLVGGAFAAQRYFLGATPTSTRTQVTVQVLSNQVKPTSTPSRTWTPEPSATFTASATQTSTATATDTATHKPTLGPTAFLTATPVPTDTSTPVPQCAPDEFFDPVMNRCRTNTQPSNSGSNGSGSSGGSSGGSGGAATPTPPFIIVIPTVCIPVPFGSPICH